MAGGGYTSISGALRKYDNLGSPRLLTTGLTQEQAAVIEGDVYSAVAWWRDVPTTALTSLTTTTADRYLKISSPAVSSGRLMAVVLRLLQSDLGGIEYQLFTGGTNEALVRTITPRNTNGTSAETSTVTIEEVTLDAVTGEIVGSLSFIPGIGQSTPGLASQGSASILRTFDIFAQDQVLYARIRNKAGAVNNLIRWELEWIEAPIPDIVLQP